MDTDSVNYCESLVIEEYSLSEALSGNDDTYVDQSDSNTLHDAFNGQNAYPLRKASFEEVEYVRK